MVKATNVTTTVKTVTLELDTEAAYAVKTLCGLGAFHLKKIAAADHVNAPFIDKVNVSAMHQVYGALDQAGVN